MDQKRSWSQHLATTSSSYPPKRQKTLRCNPIDARQYTIAWICALDIEMAAARAMLDEIHKDLPQDANDKNAYMLGSIGPHDIVIACLPSGQYGPNNATSVLTNLRWSFPSICKGLMVGIGGGVPTMTDLRLGDVVVGTRVMPYDLGKVVQGGKVQRTGSPRFPDQALLTAVSSIRAKHRLEPSLMSTILGDMSARYPEYSCPTSPDRLFLPAYSHDPQISCCSKCDQSKLLPGSTRLANDPKIHYGAIASGNHVMKDSATRDNVARELNVICFEMEAAGLMDVLPCLPIRGICDYSDSHKSKEWQEYAAATAAAYAKEFLGILPAKKGAFESLYVLNSPCEDAAPNRRQLLLESLKFEQIDSRKTSIKAAHSKTCHWFLKHPQYLAWLDPQKQAQHHGFLWIRGKPGAGKSTIMKFIYLKTKRKKSHEQTITASFFFHARGEYLEKSILGMYRSLLLQLLEGYPDLQEVLDDTDLVPKCQNGCPSMNVLKCLFQKAVSNLGQRSFTCFVDALDECDEQEIMEMAQFFEELAESCTSKGVRLQICFSSRHYPHIEIQHGLKLTLEHQPGHSQDMDNYIQSNLRIRHPALLEELRPQMLEKAAGVFLWVVLMVDILNKENRRGRLALRKRLAEAPSRLSELFKDILRRDSNNMEHLLLCILWILCAKRPLRPEEYYHALWSGLVPGDFVDLEIPNVTVSDFSDCADSCVITSSKGLAEITKAKSPAVQFIHESVRDFLIKDRGLQELWPELGSDWQSSGHERLKQCCDTYINHEVVHAAISNLGPTSKPDDLVKVSKQYPFLEYASQHVLYHSDAAAQAIPQGEFLSQTPTPSWIITINLFERFKSRKYTPEASLVYILADKGFSSLIRAWLQSSPDIDIRGERYEYPLFAALANGNKDSVAALLNLRSSIYNGVDIAEGFEFKKDFTGYKGRTPLTWAAQEGRIHLVKLLVQMQGGVDKIDMHEYTPLMRASQAGHQAVVSFLLDEGATVNRPHARSALSLSLGYDHLEIGKLLIESGANLKTDLHVRQDALVEASKGGHEATAKFLIENGAEVDARRRDGRTALSGASENGHLAIVRFLVEHGADVNARDHLQRTPLSRASENGHETVARFLVEHGADVNARDHLQRTPLYKASENGHETVARLLVEHGADVNARDSLQETPLHKASENGHETVARLLVEHGADVNARDDLQRTPLFRASENGHETVARLLVEHGADVNARGYLQRTPLFRASENGHETVARLLVEHGADVNARGYLQRTPLYQASKLSSPTVAELLIKNGATIDASDDEGRTPSHIACDYGATAVQQLLIENGADVNARDQKGQTPLHISCVDCPLESRHEMMQMLIDNGANVDSRDDSGYTPRSLVQGIVLPTGLSLASVIKWP
ncbi:hypothetical protein ACHAPT_003978 [Fusarium lateritium]